MRLVRKVFWLSTIRVLTYRVSPVKEVKTIPNLELHWEADGNTAS